MARHAPYHLGSLTAGALVTDPPNAPTVYTETRSWTCKVPGIPNSIVEIARKDAVGTKKGAVIMSPGSAGKDWSCGTVATEAFVDVLKNEGWEVIQTRWTPVGWLESTNDGKHGLARLAGRVATVLKWASDTRIAGTERLVALSVSAGGSAVGLALGRYNLASRVALLVATGGPPHGNLVRFCSAEAGYGGELGQKQQVDDAWDKENIARPCELNQTAVMGSDWWYDSLLSGSLAWPFTYYGWGLNDTTVAPAHAELVAAQQPTSRRTRAYLPDTAHDLLPSAKGRQFIGNAINERALTRQASNQSATATSLAIALGKPVKAGNLLVVVHRSGADITAMTPPTDFTLAAELAIGATGLRIYSKVAAGGEETGLSVGSGATSTLNVAHYFEVEQRGVANWAVDQTAVTPDTMATSVTTLTCGPTGVPVTAKEWCVAAVGTAGGFGTSNDDWTNSYVQQYAIDAERLLSAVRSIDVAEAQSTTVTWVTARRAGGLLVTFRSA